MGSGSGKKGCVRDEQHQDYRPPGFGRHERKRRNTKSQELGSNWDPIGGHGGQRCRFGRFRLRAVGDASDDDGGGLEDDGRGGLRQEAVERLASDNEAISALWDVSRGLGSFGSERIANDPRGAFLISTSLCRRGILASGVRSF